ncbi:hypothetical protein EHQ05_09750 [Leptospira yasudae]|uniref:hypothetical protein n=1 Tax=Leptospira yasudae TaxID=2202201 RepID=UPI00108317E7|nr:hypothetical protein [Leptospira yasudae]TGK27132.1 hypothetical protein EHQ05_09750 [Leptospira yasudae]TGM08075.1 hypothetical protein EHQ86_03420 [Leptospira yasudae]
MPRIVKPVFNSQTLLSKEGSAEENFDSHPGRKSLLRENSPAIQESLSKIGMILSDVGTHTFSRWSEILPSGVDPT